MPCIECAFIDIALGLYEGAAAEEGSDEGKRFYEQFLTDCTQRLKQKMRLRYLFSKDGFAINNFR